MKPENVNISVSAGGLKFQNPFILASAPPTSNGDFIRKAFSLGWAGAVTKTIKPDELSITDVMPRFSVISDEKRSAIGFENIELVSKQNLSYWIKEIASIKQQFPEKILIASIMADLNEASWQHLALSVQEAGSDAIELNFSCPHGMPEKGLGSAIGQDPGITGMITNWVKQVADIPVIVKLSPNVTDIQQVAKAAVAGGADSIAAINTVQCISGVDIETLEPLPAVGGFSTFGGYSGSAVKPIGLRCVAQIAQSVNVPIYGMGGVRTWSDAVEYIALGADVVQVCTEVMLKGFSIIGPMIQNLINYMQRKGFKNLAQIKGTALKRIVSHEQLSRDYIVKATITDVKKCTSCGKCALTCSEAGYCAISVLKKDIYINEDKCDGCSLCSIVCPQKVIEMVRQDHLDKAVV